MRIYDRSYAIHKYVALGRLLGVTAALVLGCSAASPAAGPSAAAKPVPQLVAVAPDAGQAKTPPAPPDPFVLLGTPSDVHTRPGIYSGYEVYVGCPFYEQPLVSAIFVRGTGTREFLQPTDAQLRDAWQRGGDRELDSMRLRAEGAFWELARSVRAVAGVPSIWGVAGVGTCKTSGWWNGNALGLQLNDWRDVDAAIARIGQWLARERYQGEVVLRIEHRYKAILL